MITHSAHSIMYDLKTICSPYFLQIQKKKKKKTASKIKESTLLITSFELELRMEKKLRETFWDFNKVTHLM